MEKQFVPYELALELRKIGFDDLCLARWYGGGFEFLPAYEPLRNSEIKEPYFWTLPLWQQAFDWFRDNYKLNASIYPLNNKYSSQVYDMNNNNYATHIDLYDNYYEAIEACLNKLIKIGIN